MPNTPVVCKGVVIGRVKSLPEEYFSWFRGRLIRTIHVKHNGVIRKKIARIRFRDGVYVVRNLWHTQHLPDFVGVK